MSRCDMAEFVGGGDGMGVLVSEDVFIANVE
jgi:hypothetical protein